MGLNEKVNNSAEKGLGAAKEAAGKLLDDRDREHEGRVDQVSAETKQAGAKIKDAAEKLKDGFTK